MVEGDETVADQRVALQGDLVVRSDGSLTLRNVDLSFAESPDRQHGVRVESGGSLSIEGGTLGPARSGDRIFFDGRGASIEIQNATLTGVGRCDENPDACADDPGRAGVRLGANRNIVRWSTVLGGGIGLVIDAPGAIVERTRIEGNDACGVVLRSDGATLRGNRITQSVLTAPHSNCVIAVRGAHNTLIVGNEFRETPFPPGVPGQGDSGGVNSDAVVGTIFENNTVTGQRGIVVWTGSNNLVRNNAITCGESCLYFGSGRSNRAERNEMVAVGFVSGVMWDGILVFRNTGLSLVGNHLDIRAAQTAKSGIQLRDVHDSWILGNVVERGGNLSEGIAEDPKGPDALFLQHSTNNTVMGNRLVGLFGGLLLYGGADRNRAEGNEIQGTRAVTVVASRGNLILRNDIAEGSIPSYDAGGNSWSVAGSGNFWRGTSSGPTHVVAPGGRDDAPLASPPGRIARADPGHDASVEPARRLEEGGELTPLVENQVREIPFGFLKAPWPSGQAAPERVLRIRNSTLILGRDGPVEISATELIVEGSQLIAATPGFGFSILSPERIVLRDSLIDGAYLEDVATPEIVIEGSTIANSSAVSIHESFGTLRSVVVANSTIRAVAAGVTVGSAEHVTFSGNRVYDGLTLGLGVAPEPSGPDGLLEVVVDGNVVDRVWKGAGIDVFARHVLDRATLRGNLVANTWGGITVGAGGFQATGNTLCDNHWPSQPGEGSWEGNYYFDYNGSDANHDGIGDEPYAFQGRLGTDPRPLIAPPGLPCPGAITNRDNGPTASTSPSTEAAPPVKGPTGKSPGATLPSVLLVIAAAGSLVARRRSGG